MSGWVTMRNGCCWGAVYGSGAIMVCGSRLPLVSCARSDLKWDELVPAPGRALRRPTGEAAAAAGADDDAPAGAAGASSSAPVAKYPASHSA